MLLGNANIWVNKRKIMKDVFQCLEEISQTLYKLIAGLIAAMFGYFLPIRDFVHLLIFLLIVDMLFGYWANRVTRGEEFLFKKVWFVTFPRMIVGVVLIVSAYLWDVVYHQTTVETYVIVGWILSGFTFLSIVQNAYKITNWIAINEIGNLLAERIPIDKIPIIKSKKDEKDKTDR